MNQKIKEAFREVCVEAAAGSRSKDLVELAFNLKVVEQAMSKLKEVASREADKLAKAMSMPLDKIRKEAIPEAFGYTEFTYTLADLKCLRNCVAVNVTLSEAIRAFHTERNFPDDEFFFWLQQAERILKDPRYPEKVFGPEKVPSRE